MRNKFNFIASALSTAFFISLSACGGDSSSSPEGDVDLSKDETVPTESSSSFVEMDTESSESRGAEELSSSDAEQLGSEESSSSSAEEESSSSERYAWQHLNKNLSYGELVNGTVVYKTIKIGNHTWMAENMGISLVNPSERNGKYASMYYGYQAKCPAGWHIPSIKEWQTLFGEDVLDGELWLEAGANGESYKTSTNASGFSALPGGRYRNSYIAEAAVEFLSSDTTTYRNPSTGDYSTVYEGVVIKDSYAGLKVMTNYEAFRVLYYVRCIMDPEGFDYIVNYLEKDLLGKPEMNCSETLKDKIAYVAHDYKKAVCKQDETTQEWLWVEEDLDWMVKE